MLVSYTAGCIGSVQLLCIYHYSDNDLLPLHSGSPLEKPIYFPKGLKQKWHLVTLLYSFNCDLVSGSIGFSGNDSYRH